MSQIEEKLFRLETGLQTFVERLAGQLLPGERLSELLARRLMDAVRGGLRVLPDGQLAAPERLVVLVCPEELGLFQNPDLLREIETALRQIGLQQGILFPEGGFLQVDSSLPLAPGELQVVSLEQAGCVSQTTDVSMTGLQAVGNTGAGMPQGAYLIVDGVQVFSLDKPVVNLGRRPDNHLVIDDPRISRTHSQIRLRAGQFVIFDLESSGGTFVNGRRIYQHILHPGDVISLAGVPLIFGQDSPGLTETQEFTAE
jgi:hypothetical protein